VYRHLLAGGSLPGIRSPDFLGSNVVHLDTQMRYARYYAIPVYRQRGWTLAYGPPACVLTTILIRVLVHLVAMCTVWVRARPRWRDRRTSRVIVTDRSTWCRVGSGRWLEFVHQAVVNYEVDGSDIVMTFADAEPLRLTGPSAWLHAVIFARLRLGPQRWRNVPWLYPLQIAATQHRV